MTTLITGSAIRYAGVVLAAATLSACEKTNPTQPSGAAPIPVQPASNAQIHSVDQPVTLVVQNAISASPAGGKTYTFEVAGDSAFTSKVQTKGGVAEGGGGQTSVKLDVLASGQDYYWHARLDNGGSSGGFSATYKFSITPAITLNTPVLVSPLDGTPVSGWPTLTVADVTRSGPVGSLAYRFEIATSPAFAAIVVTGTVAETANQTSFTPPSQPPPTQSPLFWRVIALDQTNGVSSAASATQSFAPTRQSLLASQLGLVLWPAAQPPGSNGHAVLGNNWDFQNLVSFAGVPFVTPTLDMLQLFDVIDRGFDPQSAIDWMHNHGYPTPAAYFPTLSVIGFEWEYLALISGRWDVVIRIGP